MLSFEVPGKSLKLLGKTLACLSKLGNEVFIEGRDDRVVLRALNASRSAFAGVTLHRTFFDRCTVVPSAAAAAFSGSSSGGSCGGGPVSRCQVKLKPLCAVFRASTLGAVERCTVTADPACGRLAVSLRCQRGVVKDYAIPFDDECEALEARYDTAGAARVVVRPRVLLDALANFRQTSADELTLLMPPRTAPANARVVLRSSQQPAAADAHQAPVVTECSIDPHSFDDFVPAELPSSASATASSAPPPSGVSSMTTSSSSSSSSSTAAGNGVVSLTFSLKDFKHMCSLCEAVAVPMSMHMTYGGQPLVLSTRFFNSFETVFVLATLLEHQPHHRHQQHHQTPPPTTQAPSVVAKQHHQEEDEEEQMLHEIKQSPSTPATVSAQSSIYAGAIVKKRSQSPVALMDTDSADADEMEMKRPRRSPAAAAAVTAAQAPTEPATPVMLPKGRLFLGDENMDDTTTTTTPAVAHPKGDADFGMDGRMDSFAAASEESVPASCPR